ncbi:MAG: cytochrome c3 family protein, partial [Phycisphaerae bacterium]
RRMLPRENLLDACRGCHSDYFSDRVRHAPVEQGQCTECHNMHRSTQHALLTMPVGDLCIECHDEPEDLSEPAHTVQGVANCTGCHDPHFGGEMLMKPQPSMAVPR